MATQHMAQIERFNFLSLQDFTSPHKKREEKTNAPEAVKEQVEQEAPPPPPTFSQEELDEAVEKARTEGIKEGKDQQIKTQRAEQIEHDKKTFQMMEHIAGLLTNSRQFVEHYTDTKTDELTCLALAIGTKLAGNTLKDDAAELIRETLHQCLPELLVQPSLIVRVHPDMREEISIMFDSIASKHRYEGEYEVKTDAEMHHSDVRIEWKFGQANRSFKQICTSLDDIFADAQRHIDTQGEPEPRVMPIHAEPAGSDAEEAQEPQKPTNQSQQSQGA